jgi:dTDP-4-amino-4,6-dideoxygalactose transaminase
LKYIRHLFKLFKLLALPCQICFVQGHSHLSKKQVLWIKQVLNSDDSEEVVNEYEQRMTSLIGSGYGISFAAGRMAFYSLLKALNIGLGDEVVLPGFTCSVMPNAVWRTGATPVFADIDSDTFGSDAGGVEKKITSRTKLIVAQHSFGIPCNVPAIVEVGKKYGIFVMEDSAIALDSAIDGIKVGNWGDAAIFSTDHSKPLNTLIGGFLYTKDKALYKRIKNYSDNLPHLNNVHQQRLFKQFLFERKNYTPERYPRSIIINSAKALTRKIKLRQKQFVFLEADYTKQSSSGSNYPYPAKLPSFLAQLGLYELDRWDNEKKRRKILLKNYLRIANSLGLDEYLPKAYTDSKLEIVPLRFVFEHPNVERLKAKMERYVDVGWTWFRTPVICCPDGPESLGYVSGSCEVGETAGKNIINWPCVLPEKWHDKVLRIFEKVARDID